MCIKVKLHFVIGIFFLPVVSLLKRSIMDKMNQENLLIKYYDGNATEEEVREIEAWIRMSDENYKKAKEIYTLLLAADTKLVTDKIDMEKELSLVKAQAKSAASFM